MRLRSLILLTPALAFCVMTAASATQPKEQLAIQKDGIQLIGQVGDVAGEIRYHADRLNTLTRSTMVSKWTHSHHLTEIRTLVNEGLQPAFQRLTEIRSQLPAWKQRSIDSMLASAKALASDANSAILTHNDAGTVPHVMNPEYRRLVERIYQHADALMKAAVTAQEYATQQLKTTEGASDSAGK